MHKSSPWELSLRAKICENCTTVSLACMLEFWASPIAWHAVGPKVSGPHGNGHHCAVEWCHKWIYYNTCSYLDTHLLKNLTGKICIDTVLFHNLQSRNMGPLMSLWASLNRFTTWCTFFTLCCNFVTNNYLPSQLYCQCVCWIKRVTTSPTLP